MSFLRTVYSLLKKYGAHGLMEDGQMFFFRILLLNGLLKNKNES